MHAQPIDGTLPEFAMQKAPIVSVINSVFYLRVGWSRRLISSSAHQLISSSAHQLIRPPLRLGAHSSTNRLHHPDSLTSGRGPATACGLADGPIPVSGLDGLTRSSSPPVTRHVAVTGSGTALILSHSFPRSERTARKQRGRSLTAVRFWLRLSQRLRPMRIPKSAFLSPH